MARKARKPDAGGRAERPAVAAFACRASAGGRLAEAVEKALSASCDVEIIPLVCSGQLRTGHMLAAFEGGADAVAVFACPEGMCRYGTGSKSSAARVEKARMLLVSLGISGARLARFESSAMGPADLNGRLSEFAAGISALGPLAGVPAPAGACRAEGGG